MRASIWLTVFFVAWVLQMMVVIKLNHEVDSLTARIKPLEYQANRTKPRVQRIRRKSS